MNRLIQIGPYVEGEVPEPLSYGFEDSNGEPVDLTGFTATFVLRTQAEESTLPATITDAAGGVVEHVWLEGELTKGTVSARFWVTNGTNTYASVRIKSNVERS